MRWLPNGPDKGTEFQFEQKALRKLDKGVALAILVAYALIGALFSSAAEAAPISTLTVVGQTIRAVPTDAVADPELYRWAPALAIASYFRGRVSAQYTLFARLGKVKDVRMVLQWRPGKPAPVKAFFAMRW